MKIVDFLKKVYTNPDREMRFGAYLATVIMAVLVAWVATAGLEKRIDEEGASTEEAADATGEAALGAPVRYYDSKATERSQIVKVSGTTYPDSVIMLVAERAGKLTEQLVDEGSYVKKGRVLFRLDSRDISARKRQLEANRKQVELQLASSRALKEKGLQSDLGSAASEAGLAGIESQIDLLELELERSEIRAPADGYFESKMLEVGSFASPGVPVAKIIVLNPMKVQAALSQREIAKLGAGSETPSAKVTVRSTEYAGKISRISAEADNRTRSFTVDIEVDNDDYALKSGFSAEVEIILDRVPYHAIQSSWLLLGDGGELGLKILDDDDTVGFVEVELGETSNGSVWVSGLPPSARIVTLGQELAVVGRTATATRDTRYDEGSQDE